MSKRVFVDDVVCPRCGARGTISEFVTGITSSCPVGSLTYETTESGIVTKYEPVRKISNRTITYPPATIKGGEYKFICAQCDYTVGLVEFLEHIDE